MFIYIGFTRLVVGDKNEVLELKLHLTECNDAERFCGNVVLDMVMLRGPRRRRKTKMKLTLKKSKQKNPKNNKLTS
jgi:hypothetical protein